MATTIQIESKLKDRLEKFKMHKSESYNDVIERVLEDLSVLNEETRKDLDDARKAFKSGKYSTHEQVGKELGFS